MFASSDLFTWICLNKQTGAREESEISGMHMKLQMSVNDSQELRL